MTEVEGVNVGYVADPTHEDAVMRIDYFTDAKSLKFKTDDKTRILSHNLEEYNEKELRELHDLYTSDEEFQYTLKLNEGETITGKLVGDTPQDYLFDIGYKDYLVVEKRKEETLALAQYGNDDNNVIFGTKVKIFLTEVSDEPYIIRGSISAIYRRNAINEIIEDQQIAIDAFVKDWKPAGFTLELNYKGEKIQSFMPNVLSGVNKLSPEDSEALVGEKIQVMVESYTKEKGTFIVSRKKYLESLLPVETAKLSEKISTQQETGEFITFTGVVTGTADYGVFVEFSADEESPKILTGMIHRSNFDEETKKNLSTIEGGDSINFYVKDISGVKNINLTQVIRETLWDTIEAGQVVEGKIKDHKPFGILIKFDEETVGLVHNAELEKTNRIFSVGDKIKTKVLTVSKSNRKINLAIAD